MTQSIRIGIDLGGTKIATIAFDEAANVLDRRRIAAPKGDYKATLAVLKQLVNEIETETGGEGRVGIGMPGSLCSVTGLVQNANSTWLNGQDFKTDVETLVGRKVRFSNDANCFVLSEAADGSAAGENVVFGVIIGTGCGGAIAVNGQLLHGRHHIAGEWGHNPLPWPNENELPGPECWCGRQGCLETWISGSGLERDHLAVTGNSVTAREIAQIALDGDILAKASLARHQDRLARGLAHISNLIDPDVIVLGGGLSNMAHLYDDLGPLMSKYVFADHPKPNICRPAHGDASGVRGAARLWD